MPPFNGFIGELMIYLAAFSGICSGVWQLRFAGIAAALILSLTGACAVAAFAKAIGGTFLGEPRKISECKKESPLMYAPMLFLLLLSLLVVFSAPLTVPVIFKALNFTVDYEKTGVVKILSYAASFSALFYVLSAVILWARRYLLCRGAENASGPTWDCGYAKPTARMEYTGSALIQCIADLFNSFLKIRRKVDAPQGLFPEKASFEWESPDCAERLFWAPLFNFTAGVSDKIHKFQSGYLHIYGLIMTVALIAMVFWAIVS